MKIDDRVQHEFLDTGTIVNELDGDIFLVKFDINPPPEYNTSQNPCLVFEEDLALYNTDAEYEASVLGFSGKANDETYFPK